MMGVLNRMAKRLIIEDAEQKYKAKNGVELTFLEDPYDVANYVGKSKLLVIFQSMGNEKSESPAERFPYTLIDGLKHFNCRKIYIKDDFGLVGSYYLGLNGKFDVEEAVVEFLKHKINSYGIRKDDITFFGISKGAYASLNFGFKLGIENIIGVVPQFDLMAWIENYKPFLSYLLPEDADRKIKRFYSSYLENVIKNSRYKPNVYLVTSINDETYEDHIPQLVSALKEKDINTKIYSNDEIFVTRHNQVAKNSMNEILAFISHCVSECKI